MLYNLENNKHMMWKYKEFNPDYGLKSIKEDFQKSPYEKQWWVARYLDRGETDLIGIFPAKDAIADKFIPWIGTFAILTDGEYYWNNVTSYYVRKYNLKLPDEFIKKAVEFEKNKFYEMKEIKENTGLIYE